MRRRSGIIEERSVDESSLGENMIGEIKTPPKAHRYSHFKEEMGGEIRRLDSNDIKATEARVQAFERTSSQVRREYQLGLAYDRIERHTSRKKSRKQSNSTGKAFFGRLKSIFRRP